MARLEHVNLTVPDIHATAQLLGALFGWRVRWQGPSIHGGETLHVGGDDQYLALYSGKRGTTLSRMDSYTLSGGLNHIGIVVEDLEKAEDRLRQLGLIPHSHADYEPGRRFYFDGPDGVEYELVCYNDKALSSRNNA